MSNCEECIYCDIVLGENQQCKRCMLGVFDEYRNDVGEAKFPPEECDKFSPLNTSCCNPKLEGKKYDTGKNRVGLMCEGFSRALWEVAKVSTFGANRYGANNWQLLDNPKERYMDALCRHLFQHLQGKKVDDDSGLLHLQHCAWNVLALLEFELKEREDDDA